MITTETECRLEAEENGIGCAIEFFKIRFPGKFNEKGECWDKVYLDEWAHRFRNGSAWQLGDLESRRAIIKLHIRGLITLYAKVDR